MKRIILIFCSLVSALLFTGCGGNKGITPAKETISGPLGQYFKVVNRSYKINEGKVNIEIERIEDGLPDPWEEGIEVGYSDNRVEPGFVVEFMDEDGDVVCKGQTDIVRTKDELVSVVALAVGETSTIPFSAKGKKIAQFRVSSTFVYHEPVVNTHSYNSSYNSSYDSPSSEGSLLDEVANEYSNALNEAQKELQDAYDEAASEVRDAVKDALKDLF